ncbi:hypothetical protein Dimus_027032 [Dionaea muscipula]
MPSQAKPSQVDDEGAGGGGVHSRRDIYSLTLTPAPLFSRFCVSCLQSLTIDTVLAGCASTLACCCRCLLCLLLQEDERNFSIS